MAVIRSNSFKRVLTFLCLLVILLPYQNCAGPFEATREAVNNSVSSSGASCMLAGGAEILDGDLMSGYARSSAVSPLLCGSSFSSRCTDGVLVPSSGTASPASATCTQYCLHPDSNQPVASGTSQGTVTIPQYYTIARGTSQAQCDAARRPTSTTICDSATGLFVPSVLPQAQRFSNCQVVGAPVMCAYPAGNDYVQPAALTIGSRVSGLSATSALYPRLCSQLTVERTCLSTGQWNGAVPVYKASACVQQCMHPKTSAPVSAAQTYQYYAIAQGSQADCTAARRTAACSQTTGTFLDTTSNQPIAVPPAQQYATCAVVVPPQITAMAASAASITSGAPVTISWSVSANVMQLILNNGATDTDVTGRTSQTFYPTAATATNVTYTLRAINIAGTVTRSVTVVVNPATPNPPAGSINQARIFFTGHSLVDFLPRYIPDVVTASGSQLQYNHQFAPGSTLSYRTRGMNRNSTTWGGYSLGTNRTGSNMNIINEFLNPQTITGGRYDTLVVTERHDLIGSLQYEDTTKYLRHYHERFRAGNAQGITYFYESWWRVVSRTNPAAWVDYERKASMAWQCVATRVNRSLEGEGRSDRLRSIPAGAAFAELVARATQGNVTGVTGANVSETMGRLFTDGVHPTTLAGYYMSLVVYSAVYRQAPTGMGAPADISAATVSALQTIAWDFIRNYYATNTPLTLAQCQDYFRDNFCLDYWSYLGQSQNANGCRNHFTQQNANNPFYYNAAQDASFWFPAP